MNLLFKKPNWVGMMILSLMLVVFTLNAWILSLNLLQPYDDLDLFSLANDIQDGGSLIVFSFVLVILFYLTLVPLLLSTISVIRKSNWAIMPSVFYLLGFLSVIVIFQVIEGLLSGFALVLVSITLFFVLAAIFLSVLRQRLLGAKKVTHKPISKAILTSVLVIDVMSLVVFMTTFFVPIYSLMDLSPAYHAIIIGALFNGDTNFEVIGYFLLNFTVLLGLFLFLSDIIAH
ncbi:MAG: hypothetical protein RBQ70_04305, partial [Acholeplasma sp.]|nr:hypothetical protein [Acholeplasma sp.]